VKYGLGGSLNPPHMEAIMATLGLNKITTPARSVYNGSGEFQATTGEVVKLEKTGVEYVEYDVPAGETWTVTWTMRVVVS